VNLTTIAAFLTLIGYSVNDTVVLRPGAENCAVAQRALIEVMNRSINQTLSRTILTGGSVLLAAGALLTLGGDVLRGLAFVLRRVIIGTYSSIYVASPFALLWAQRFGRESARSAPPAPPRRRPPPRPARARRLAPLSRRGVTLAPTPVPAAAP
jgi:preprotein translocase subunit SecF